jgi:pteridine reductase
MQKRNEVVLVTGGAKRVGAVISRRLHGEGKHVVVHYHRSADAAKALVSDLNAQRPNSAACVSGDLLDTAALNDLAERALQCFGRIDGLVNNASSFHPGTLGHVDEAHWTDLIGTNLKAPLFLTQALATQLRANKGFVINITDIHADRPLRDYLVYTVAKAGLAGLTRSLALELSPDVRVNAVAPGPVLWPDEGEIDTFNAAERTRIIDQTMLKRAGTPEDVADAVCFLACNAPYVTGHILPVDGGRHAYL